MLRVRTGMDGCFWIAHSDKETEDFLDNQFERLPNQLKWFGKKAEARTSFKNMYEGQLGYLVGKGPSLDFLRRSHFEEMYSPIICINESIHIVEKLSISNPRYVTQLDAELQETCRPSYSDTKMLLGPQCANLYLEGVYRYVFDPAMFGLYDCISAEFAIMMLRHMGCTRLQLIGFDSCTQGNLEYAKCIGYSSLKGGPQSRFLEHKKRILTVAKEMPLAWVTPRADGTSLISETV